MYHLPLTFIYWKEIYGNELLVARLERFYEGKRFNMCQLCSYKPRKSEKWQKGRKVLNKIKTELIHRHSPIRWNLTITGRLYSSASAHVRNKHTKHLHRHVNTVTPSVTWGPASPFHCFCKERISTMAHLNGQSLSLHTRWGNTLAIRSH